MQTTTASPTVAAFDDHLVVRYTIITTVLGLAIMTTPALIGQPSEAGALAMTYGLLPGGSVLTAPPRRPRRVRLLFSGLLRPRCAVPDGAGLAVPGRPHRLRYRRQPAGGGSAARVMERERPAERRRR